MRLISLLLAGALVVACAKGVTRDTEDDDGGSVGGGGVGVGGGVSGTCNNGRLDAGEQCDGDQFGATTCQSLGLMTGTLACDPNTCIIDATGCSSAMCGDDVVDAAEECDGTNLDGQTCAMLGFTGGTLACDGECKFTGCNDAFSDDFEGGSLGAEWTTSGSGLWAPSSVTPHAGAYCAKSGLIIDSQTSSISTTLTFEAAGTVTFWHRESSEFDYDFLQFYVDQTLQAEWSGMNAWATATFNLAMGTHVLEWRYSKDSSISEFEDAVYIDDISVTNGVAP